MRQLYEDMASLLDMIIEMHTPQIFILATLYFVATLTNLYFGQLSFTMCMGLKMGVPLIMWAYLQSQNFFFIINSCQSLSDQLGVTENILKLAPTSKLDQAAQFQVSFNFFADI